MKQYIDKAALVAEIEKIMNEQQEICKANVALGKNPDPKNVEVIYQFQQFIKYLNTLEVKEVELDEEADNYWETLTSDVRNSIYFNDFYKIAKHFFELGLKAQKGEKV